MVTRWDPFSELNRLHDQYFLPRGGESEARAARPAVDIREEGTAFFIHVEVPGVKQEDVNVEVDRGMLTIRAERKSPPDDVKKTFRRVERYYGTTSRSFALPDNADPEAISAELADGVLHVRIPKRAEKASRKIAVKAA